MTPQDTEYFVSGPLPKSFEGTLRSDEQLKVG